MKKVIFLSVIFLFTLQLRAQPANCTFKPPTITIHFGTGNVRDVNTDFLPHYERVSTYCPPDGYYSYAPYTSNCFNDDWHTLTEDHTPGDIAGNMLLVNGAPRPGPFLITTINGLKSGTIYEFGVWLMNLCKPSDKCPFPLLPNLIIRLETPDGQKIAQFATGYLPRLEAPQWTQHRAIFTTPQSITLLKLIMIDTSPGGCGNDFVLDDITLRECIITPPVVAVLPKPTVQKITPVKKQQLTSNPVAKKSNQIPKRREIEASKFNFQQIDSTSKSISNLTGIRNSFPPPPSVLTTRTNALVRKIETQAGEIKIDLYDNGEIDGDTVSIYHNNVLVKEHAGLTDKPISFSIMIDSTQPHHELIMVAENLGSIPPNTSLMIITAGGKRYEVFISSTEQKNAKVIFDLKK